MDIGPCIGTGKTAEIYSLGPDRVVKRFKEQVPRDVVEREVANTRGAVDADLPVPFVYGCTMVDDTPAIIYERVRGTTMLSRLLSRPWTLRQNAHRLARLQTQIHAVQPSELRSVRERLRQNIHKASGLEPEARQCVLSMLETLPQRRAFCHGDFHPENVLLADEPVVIDWLDAGQGHPAADVARTNILLKFAGQQERGIRSVIWDLFRRWYLRFYSRQSGVSREQIRDWELPVATARLTENVPEEAQLRSFIVSRLHNE